MLQRRKRNFRNLRNLETLNGNLTQSCFKDLVVLVSQKDIKDRETPIWA